MTKITFTIGITVAAALLAGSAFAGTNDPVVRQRETIQQERINQGVQSGALTPRETSRLEAQQSRIKQREERMKADGNLNRFERARLARKENRASRTIYRKTHNARTAAAQ